MKRIIFLISWAIFNIGFIYSQSFAPFNDSVTKRFYKTSSPVDNNYYYYAESADTIADTLILQQYLSVQNFDTPIDVGPCGFWGAGGYAGADTTWLGLVIKYNFINQHLFLYNDQNQILDFDFSLAMGDSALFYADSANFYYIKLMQAQSESIYTVTDSVKTFIIMHYDNLFSPVFSPLHGATIKLSNNYGLISFINVYSFPAIENHLSLQGQYAPLLGNYQITYEEIYPFYSGDSIQYQGTRYDSWSSAYYVNSYQVTNRTETVDSVTITMSNWQQFIYQNGPAYILNPYPLSGFTYPKNTPSIPYPYNRISTGAPRVTLSESESWVICDSALSLLIAESSEIYCAGCSCYGGLDGFGQTFSSYQYSVGLGKTYIHEWLYGPGFNYHDLNLSYYNIGGIECGNYEYIGIENQQGMMLQLNPNPATDMVISNLIFDSVRLYNLQGQLQLTELSSNSFDVSFLGNGVYLAIVNLGDKQMIQKITVAH